MQLHFQLEFVWPVSVNIWLNVSVKWWLTSQYPIKG